LMYCWNVLGEFAMLKGVISYLNSPNLVWKAVFYSSPGATRILWKAAITSSLVNYLALLMLLSVSRMSGRGY
jgi:hypothetical protein